MPLYLYKNPLTNEIVEVIQGMNDIHEYEEDGIKFERVFTIPQASISTKIDPFSKNSFLEKTNKAGTYGDILDRSKELSEKRREIIGEGGKDPLQEKYFDEYSKARNGKKHQLDTRPKPKKRLEDAGNKS